MTSLEEKTEQFTRRKIRGSRAGIFLNLFKFQISARISNNTNITSSESKNEQFTRRIIRGSRAGAFVHLFNFWIYRKLQKSRKLQVLNCKLSNLQEWSKSISECVGIFLNLLKFRIYRKLQKYTKMTSFEYKKYQFTRRKIRGSRAGIFLNLFKFRISRTKSKNQRKWQVLNRKLSNLQEGKFEVPEQAYFGMKEMKAIRPMGARKPENPPRWPWLPLPYQPPPP